MRHDSTTAVDFLARVMPDAPWIVTAILPDAPEDRRDKINNQIFGWNRRGDFVAWLDHFNPTHNVYYGVNPVRPGVARASKIDITAVRYLHVDLDARAWMRGEDGETDEDRRKHFAAELVRLYELFVTPRPETLWIPRPHALIASGGGYNGLIRLETPIELDHTVEAAEQAERYNIALSLAYGGDDCHDVSRILRLPGTVNHPNAHKRSIGRVTCMSSLVWCEPGAYPLSMFRAAAPKQTNDAGSRRGRPKSIVPGFVEPVTDVNQIVGLAKHKEHIRKVLLDTIAQGAELDPARWQGKKGAGDCDHSRAVFWVTCELLRAGLSKESIYAIITSPAFKISEHVRKQRSNARRTAMRTIDRASDRVEGGEHGDLLCDMNDKFFVVHNYGGKCIVMKDDYDHVLERNMLRAQEVFHFKLAYSNRLITVGEKPNGDPIVKTVGEFWFHHERRRDVELVAFAPGQELPDTIYNLWQGFAVDATPGQAHKPFLDHIRTIICNGNDEHYTYLINWMAHIVQNPGKPTRVAVVLRGGQGTGKGTFATYFGMLFGRHFMQIKNAKHLIGHFNGHQEALVFMCVDEAFFAGDKEHENVLKSLITDVESTIENKRFDIRHGRNFINLLFLSNKNWIVPAAHDDRRFCVFDLPVTSHPEDYDWAGLRHTMDPIEKGGEGGVSDLLDFLQHVDLSQFDVTRRPLTTGLANQKILSLSTEESWWSSKLDSGQLPNCQFWRDPVSIDELNNDYAAYANKIKSRVINHNALGIAMSQWVRGLTKTRETVERLDPDDPSGQPRKRRVLCYKLPPLKECRQQWDERLKTSTPWDDDEEILSPF